MLVESIWNIPTTSLITIFDHAYHVVNSSAVRRIECFEGNAIAFAFPPPFFALGECNQQEWISSGDKKRNVPFGKACKSKRLFQCYHW